MKISLSKWPGCCVQQATTRLQFKNKTLQEVQIPTSLKFAVRKIAPC